MPNRIAVNPVLMGVDPAIPAATKQAMHTGGVTKDMAPKKLINRWAAKGLIPVCTKAGAISMTSMI